MTFTPSVGAPISWSANRTVATTGGSFEVVGPEYSSLGTGTLQVLFFAGLDGSGAVVGAAGLEVRVIEGAKFATLDGKPLTKINIGEAIKSLWVGAADVEVGQSTPILVYGLNVADEYVALDPSYAVLSVFSFEGSGNAEIIGTALKGTKVGTVGIGARAGALEATNSCNVLMRTVTANQHGSDYQDMDYDSTRGRAWVTTASGNLLCVNPSTGAIERTYPVGTAPDRVSVSADGAVAYVSDATDGKIRQVRLSDGNVNWEVQLPVSNFPDGNVTIATDIDANPWNADEVAVCCGSKLLSGSFGPVIIRGGILLAEYPKFEASQVVYVASDVLVGCDSEVVPAFAKRFSISETGCALVGTSAEETNGGAPILYGGNVVLATGETIDPGSLSQVGTVKFDGSRNSLVAGDATAGRVWTASTFSNTVITALNGSNYDVIEPVKVGGRPISSSLRGFRRLSGNSLGFISEGSLFVIPQAPGL